MRGEEVPGDEQPAMEAITGRVVVARASPRQSLGRLSSSRLHLFPDEIMKAYDKSILRK